MAVGINTLVRLWERLTSSSKHFSITDPYKIFEFFWCKQFISTKANLGLYNGEIGAHFVIMSQCGVVAGVLDWCGEGRGTLVHRT